MDYFNKTQLKERNWTDTAINKFLLFPDGEKINPVCRSAPKMKLYLQDRVFRIENSEDFRRWLNKSFDRKKSAQKAVLSKKESLIQQVNNWTIDVSEHSYVDILKLTVDNYNEFKTSIEDYESIATINSDKMFLNRIVVNFLRHQLTEYDNRLHEIAGKTGIRKAYLILNRKIYDKIAEIYPEYKEECIRQLNRKSSESNNTIHPHI